MHVDIRVMRYELRIVSGKYKIGTLRYLPLAHSN